MADDKTGTGNRDRSQAAGEDEVRHFAEEAGITLDQARTLIKRHGTDRKVLDEIAESLKAL